MDLVDHVDTLRHEGEQLAQTASELSSHVPVPTCPGWTIRDLLQHTGMVHRWACAIVSQGRAKPMDDSEIALLVGPMPVDELLVEWFREGHEQLVRAIAAAAPDLDCWSFLAAPSPLRFWARRQAHETAIHRVDVESARQDEISPISPRFAADGVDELLFGFHGRPTSRVRSAHPRILHIHASDLPTGLCDWFIHISPDPPRVTRSYEFVPDCTLSGPAELVYLALWNRCAIDDLSITGDHTVLKLWQELSQVKWS